MQIKVEISQAHVKPPSLNREIIYLIPLKIKLIFIIAEVGQAHESFTATKGEIFNSNNNNKAYVYYS